MRPATLLTSLCALGVSVSAINYSSELGQITASAGQLYSSIANGNPTSLYNHYNTEATAALASLSKMAATASGPMKSTLQAEYTSLKSILDGAQQTASNAGLAAGGNTATSGGMAAATGLPIAAGALGGLMAVVAAL